MWTSLFHETLAVRSSFSHGWYSACGGRFRWLLRRIHGSGSRGGINIEGRLGAVHHVDAQ